VSEGLAQGPYVVARVGLEPVTLQTQGTEIATTPHIVANTATAGSNIHLQTLHFYVNCLVEDSSWNVHRIYLLVCRA